MPRRCRVAENKGTRETQLSLNEQWFIGPRQVQKLAKRVAKLARICEDVTPAGLRHTFATTAAQKYVSLAIIRQILGHDRRGTTAIYLNLTNTHVVSE
jgi:integrase/recombinase XerD